MKKHQFILIIVLLISFDCFCLQSTTPVRNTIAKTGLGLGSIIAVVISWERNKSVLFAVLHGVLGWFYVIFYLFTNESN